MSAWTVISHQELGSGITVITFNSIPQTYTDLYLTISSRTTGSNPEDLYIAFNGSSDSWAFRRLYGTGSAVDSDTLTSGNTSGRIGRVNSGGYTSNTFSSTAVYIPNYGSSVRKSITSDTVEENNATQAFQMIFSTLWSKSGAVSSLTVRILSGAAFSENSSATLYGITAGSSGGVTVS
jgi:hypothetical protein